jgi:hypothetical protein
MKINQIKKKGCKIMNIDECFIGQKVIVNEKNIWVDDFTSCLKKGEKGIITNFETRINTSCQILEKSYFPIVKFDKGEVWISPYWLNKE